MSVISTIGSEFEYSISNISVHPSIHHNPENSTKNKSKYSRKITQQTFTNSNIYLYGYNPKQSHSKHSPIHAHTVTRGGNCCTSVTELNLIPGGFQEDMMSSHPGCVRSTSWNWHMGPASSSTTLTPEGGRCSSPSSVFCSTRGSWCS